MRYAIVVIAVVALHGVVDPGPAPARAAASVAGVFVGSTPCDAAIRRLLRIPVDAQAELIEWRLVLQPPPAAGAPMEYQLHFRYGLTVPNTPGLGNGIVSAERKGVWRIGRGTKANGAAVVYELDGAVAFQQVSEDVLHVLHEDRTLMSGNGGWSYTLSRDDRAEPLVDPRQAPAPDDVEPRTISPVSTGPAVFGVFEGRTPCQGIARELQITAWPGCAKTKWRVTLYQNPATREPTTYKIEGTLLRTAREGSWRIERGRATDASATVYTLAPAQGQRAMMLLRGDDNVIFFLSQQRHPMTGHAQLGYTLDRRR